MTAGEIWRIVIFFTFFAAACGWLVFVKNNSYPIMHPGLRKLFYSFVMHLIILYPLIILCCIRPIWKPSMAPIYVKIPILCHIHTQLTHVFYVFSLYISTLFNFYKIKFYYEVSEKKNTIEFRTILFFAILLLLSLLFLVIMSVSSSEIEITGSCYKYPSFWIVGIVVILWLEINLHTIYASLQHRYTTHPRYPSLQTQIQLDVYLLPCTLLSTVIARLLPFIIYNIHDYGNYDEFATHMCVLVDHFLNSCVMYWFLFGNGETNFFQNEEVIDNRADSQSRSRQPDVDFWISFTGSQPVQLDHHWIFNNNLTSLAVPNRHQRDLYCNRQVWERSVEYEFSRSRHDDSSTGNLTQHGTIYMNCEENRSNSETNEENDPHSTHSTLAE